MTRFNRDQLREMAGMLEELRIETQATRDKQSDKVASMLRQAAGDAEELAKLKSGTYGYYEFVRIDTERREMCERVAVQDMQIERLYRELGVQPKLIGWRMADYTNETASIETARNWSSNVAVLPIFEGDPNTKLMAASQAPKV
jgi:hypothetical protein